MAQRLAISRSQLLKHPPVQSGIDPSCARASRVMRESARGHERDLFGSTFERLSDRPAQLVAAPPARHRWKIGVDMQRNDGDIQLRCDLHHRSRKGMANSPCRFSKRFEFSTLRDFESLTTQRIKKIMGQCGMTAKRNMVLILPLVDQRDVDRAVNLGAGRSEEHTSELQSLAYLVCRLLLEKKKK